MNLKKSGKANLENKRGIFLQIGFILTLAFVIAAFEWKSVPNYGTSFEVLDNVLEEEEMINIPREEEIKPPPPPVPKVADVLNIIENEEITDNEFLGEDVEPYPGQEIDIDVIIEEDEVADEIPFALVEVKPSFQGEKLEGFRRWVAQHLRYPEIAAENGISGKVYVQFVVNSRGKVVDVTVVRGVDPALDREAERVVKSSPDWSPGRQRNRPVKVLFTIPINFVLQ
jgi:protein TonB